LTNAAAHIAETDSAHGGTLTNWLTTIWTNAMTTISNTAVGGSNLAMAAQGMAVGISNDLNAVTNALHTAITTEVARATGAEVGISNAMALKLALAGGVMTGPLTNEAGLYGNGLGLTNVPGTLTTAEKAVATNALTLDGGIMRGPVTNELGYYGDGLGLTNVPAAALPVFAGPSTNGVVASSAGDEAKYLKGDGTWDSPAGAGTLADRSNTWDTVTLSMTNYVHVPSGTNWLAYDPATRLLTGCVTNRSAGGGDAIQGTYPVFRLPVGEVNGAYTDFEIKGSANNFTSTVLYYYKSWVTNNAVNGDTNALVYFTDDYSADVRVWLSTTNGAPIASKLTDPLSVVQYVYFMPSHDCAVDWSTWMQATNKNLVWSWVRVDAGAFEMNAGDTKQRWNPIRPESWEVERTTP
jgi:hypothetical protein